jgi:phosphonate transport system substrate-binding protein
VGEYIGKRTGIAIKFKVLSRYGNIIDSFNELNLDGAFWGSFTGAMAEMKLGVEHIVRPLWKNGSSSYHGYIFVREDSGIKNVADMKGKSIAFVERATTAGYVFPLAYLRENGVDDIDTYFKEYYFAGSHDATIRSVLQKKVDIGCAKNTIYELLSAANPGILEELAIIARSPDVPSNGLGLRKDLDVSIKNKLKETFLNMHIDPEGRSILKIFGALRFIETTSKDYVPVFDLADKAGIDLKSYQYINK